MEPDRLLYPPPHHLLFVEGFCLSCSSFIPFWVAEGERIYTGRMKYCPLCRRYRLVSVMEGEA
jgi:hypothetical protein